MSARWRVLAASLAELGVFLVVPALFLMRYVGHFARSGLAVAPHLSLVVTVWVVIVALRLWVHRATGEGDRRVLAASLGISAFLFAGLLYYALAIAGLSYWNNVVSWELIRAYSTQIGPLSAALEIPLATLGFVVVTAFGVLWGLTWLYVSRWDWTRQVASRPSRMTLRVGGMALVLLVVIQALGVGSGRWGARGEPVSLTFRTPPYHFQNHAMAGGLRLENSMLDQQARTRYQPASDADRRNVVLIVVDGLRPDRMGVLGHERETTPALSRLAEEGSVLSPEWGLSICAESFCGLLGIGASSYIHRFSEQPITLQEVLRRHGYRVHMLLSGDHASFYGLRTVYGEVDTFVDGSSFGAYVNDDGVVLEALGAVPDWDGVPTMFQFHLMSPHLLIQRQMEPVFTPVARPSVLAGALGLPDGTPLEHVLNFYDNGVVEADHYIGRILEILEEKGYLDRGLVVVTSDHGEGLGEDGVFGHANSVRGFALNVPLIFFGLGEDAAFSTFDADRVASVVDIGPTLLRELGMPTPETWLGEPLQEPTRREWVYFQQGPLVGFVDVQAAAGPWKVWTDLRSDAWFVFNLAVDPDEACNLAPAIPTERRTRWVSALVAEMPVEPGAWPSAPVATPGLSERTECQEALAQTRALGDGL